MVSYRACHSWRCGGTGSIDIHGFFSARVNSVKNSRSVRDIVKARDAALVELMIQAITSNLTAIPPTYALIPRAHWSTPIHVSRQRFAESLSYLNTLGVGKGHLLSYRHMCRWNSKFFYQHPALTQYDYYWRVEPDVHFFCDIKYDPFRLLRDNDLVYGFNMLILDDARSFPSLWRVTKEFLTSHADLVPGENMDDLPAWLVDGRTSEYNNCQFFSNFEIGSLSFFRAKGPQAYVNFLDSVPSPFLSPLDNPHNHTNNKSNTAQSIFYTSRTGDAPVHTLSLALFAGRSRIHFFRDIGYQHDIARHCLPTSVNGKERCDCEPTGLDENFYRLVPMESPQWKPEDTCIRLFLGDGQDDEVSWLKKKEGWDKEVEMKFGGDGYGGYVRQG